MFKKIVLLTLGLALALSACGNSQSGNEAGTLVPIKLPMGYIPNIQFAPVYVMIEKGFARQQGLDVQLEHNVRETDSVALLGVGELTFAVVSGEQVLLSRAQGVPVVYVSAWYQKYPVSVVAKSEQGIASAADLKGKTIGLPGLYGANYIGVEALLASAGLTDADVTLTPIGFTQVESLATDQVQAVVGYAANEPIQLRAQRLRGDRTARGRFCAVGIQRTGDERENAGGKSRPGAAHDRGLCAGVGIHHRAFR